jgi:hypothetical protein
VVGAAYMEPSSITRTPASGAVVPVWSVILGSSGQVSVKPA